MARSKRKPEESSTAFEESQAEVKTETESTPERTEFVERESSSGVVAQRISVKLNDDGTIDFGSMRDASQKKFREAVQKSAKNPESAKILGFAEEDVKQIVTPEQAGKLYESFCAIEAFAMKFALKNVDADIVKGVFSSVSEQEHKLIDSPLAAVINKRCPESIAKYGDEIALCSALLGITMAKINGARNLQEKRNEKLESERATSAQKPTQPQVN